MRGIYFWEISGDIMKIKRVLLFGALILIGLISMRMCLCESRRSSDIFILEEKEWEELCQNRQEEILNNTLYLEQMPLPWYESELGEGYLLSLSNGRITNRITVSEGYQAAFLETIEIQNMDTIIREMQPIPYIIYNESSYCKGNLFYRIVPRCL